MTDPMSVPDAAPAQLPEGLREILSEPGWERHESSHHGEGWYEFFGLVPDTGNGGHDTIAVSWSPDDGWGCQLEPFNVGVAPATVYAAADLMKRIEQALAGSGGAGEGAEQ